ELLNDSSACLTAAGAHGKETLRYEFNQEGFNRSTCGTQTRPGGVGQNVAAAVAVALCGRQTIRSEAGGNCRRGQGQRLDLGESSGAIHAFSLRRDFREQPAPRRSLGAGGTD